MKKPYVQFSKRMVVLITLCVTAMSLLGIIVCTLYGQLMYLVEILRSYIGYATITFAAYSGNSAVEKYLVKRYENNPPVNRTSEE